MCAAGVVEGALRHDAEGSTGRQRRLDNRVDRAVAAGGDNDPLLANRRICGATRSVSELCRLLDEKKLEAPTAAVQDLRNLFTRIGGVARA